MKKKERNRPVFVENSHYDEMQHRARSGSDFSGELDVGPVKFKSHSSSSDNSSLIIGGVLAGGAIAIGAVAVTLSLLGGSKSS